MESMAAYVETVAYRDQQALDGLLGQVLNAAIALRENHDIRPNTPTSLTIDSGAARAFSFDSIILEDPASSLQFEADIQEHEPEAGIPESMYGYLQGVDVRDITRRWGQALKSTGQATIAQVCEVEPITQGVAELVGIIRMAKATNAIDMVGEETIYFSDGTGYLARARVPRVLFVPDNFPEDPSELNF
jgi:hypothetical protein